MNTLTNYNINYRRQQQGIDKKVKFSPSTQLRYIDEVRCSSSRS